MKNEITKAQQEKLREAARPLMRLLADEFPPHHMVLVTCCDAEVFVGVVGVSATEPMTLEQKSNDEDGPHVGVINHYKCPNCGAEWQDEWDCECNDRCPGCNKEIEPFESEHKEGW